MKDSTEMPFFVKYIFTAFICFSAVPNIGVIAALIAHDATRLRFILLALLVAYALVLTFVYIVLPIHKTWLTSLVAAVAIFLAHFRLFTDYPTLTQVAAIIFFALAVAVMILLLNKFSPILVAKTDKLFSSPKYAMQIATAIITAIIATAVYALFFFNAELISDNSLPLAMLYYCGFYFSFTAVVMWFVRFQIDRKRVLIFLLVINSCLSLSWGPISIWLSIGMFAIMLTFMLFATYCMKFVTKEICLPKA